MLYEVFARKRTVLYDLHQSDFPGFTAGSRGELLTTKHGHVAAERLVQFVWTPARPAGHRYQQRHPGCGWPAAFHSLDEAERVYLSRERL